MKIKIKSILVISSWLGFFDIRMHTASSTSNTELGGYLKDLSIDMSDLLIVFSSLDINVKYSQI